MAAEEVLFCSQDVRSFATTTPAASCRGDDDAFNSTVTALMTLPHSCAWVVPSQQQQPIVSTTTVPLGRRQSVPAFRPTPLIDLVLEAKEKTVYMTPEVMDFINKAHDDRLLLVKERPPPFGLKKPNARKRKSAADN